MSAPAPRREDPAAMDAPDHGGIPMSTHGSYTDDRTTQRFGEGQGGHQGGFGEGQGGQGGSGWSAQSQSRRRGEKPFFLTSEFLTLLASIAAVVIAAAV